MFLFIQSICSVCCSNHNYSNTSHVLIYQRKLYKLEDVMFDSNTSHVLIYLEHQKTGGQLDEFKYISCSYLSKDSKPDYKIISDSNTSHVLIYRSMKTESVMQGKIQIHLMFLFIAFCSSVARSIWSFKYISCSYLSSYTIFYATVLTKLATTSSTGGLILALKRADCIHA